MTISELGNKSTANFPVLMGVAEVENANVMQDLIDAEPLSEANYAFVH